MLGCVIKQCANAILLLKAVARLRLHMQFYFYGTSVQSLAGKQNTILPNRVYVLPSVRTQVFDRICLGLGAVGFCRADKSCPARSWAHHVLGLKACHWLRRLDARRIYCPGCNRCAFRRTVAARRSQGRLLEYFGSVVFQLCFGAAGLWNLGLEQTACRPGHAFLPDLATTVRWRYPQRRPWLLIALQSLSGATP